MEHAKHILRAVLLLVLIAVAFVFVRHFAIPESFGTYGHYRFNSVGDHAGETLIHGGPQMCIECHPDEGQSWSAGTHRSVSCEVCHGPLGTHPEDQDLPSVTVNRSYKLCAWCHESLAARPKDFPQVVLREHVIENGAELDGDGAELDVEGTGICLDCHDDPHNPSE